MGLFDRFRKPAVTLTERVIVPNKAVRASQLMQLEGAVLDVLAEMDRLPARLNPRWQAQEQEFSRVVASSRDLRARDYDWQQLMDVAFEVRPVVKGASVPEGMEHLAELQERMMAIATALTTPRDDEVQVVQS
ncbi:MAG TPA: hypothetical protein VHO26_14010 [Propionibacteriaceae bacterium]|nr:hypothetical protein [Propionibacteriaceae bacterium]